MAFGVLLVAAAQGRYEQAAACAIGALLPDLDHPRSSIGRVLFFVAQPLNLIAGHRGIVHAFAIWCVPLAAGLATGQTLIQWLSIGALSHCLLDCWTVSGVQAFKPFTDRNVVVFKRDWRVTTGSVQEIAVCAALLAGIAGLNYTYALGGPRKLINALVQSPHITAEEFTRAGDAVCFAKGSFRWADGRIERVYWLVVGLEGQQLVYCNGQQLIRARHGQFLRSVLIRTGETWNSTRVRAIVTVRTPALFFDSRRWHYAAAGQKAFGLIRSVDNSTPDIAVSP